MSERFHCPQCGAPIPRFPFPLLTVDCVIRNPRGHVLLVKRAHPPPGWAFPGGFVDVGETVEEAVRREVREETGLTVTALQQFRVYSDPARDARHHVATVIFTAQASGEPRGGDDAADAAFFPVDALPEPMAFDHAQILKDVLAGG